MMEKDREHIISFVTVCGAAANLGLTVLKFIAGIVGKSSAMTADAVHSLSDLVSDIVVLVMVRFSSREKDKGHDYGHGKYETLATVIVALLLIVVGGKLLAEGIEKIKIVAQGGTLEIPGKIALWVALVSVAVKEILYQWTSATGKKVNSQAMVANAWHHRSDALSSIGSFIGIGGAILFGGKWAVLDPVTGCVISVFIFFVAVKMIVPALRELTDASLPDDVENEIVSLITSIEGVRNVHELKTRKVGPDIIVDAHVVVDPMMTVSEAHRITDAAEDSLTERFGSGTQIFLHVEPDE